MKNQLKFLVVTDEDGDRHCLPLSKIIDVYECGSSVCVEYESGDESEELEVKENFNDVMDVLSPYLLIVNKDKK